MNTIHFCDSSGRIDPRQRSGSLQLVPPARQTLHLETVDKDPRQRSGSLQPVSTARKALHLETVNKDPRQRWGSLQLAPPARQPLHLETVAVDKDPRQRSGSLQAVSTARKPLPIEGSKALSLSNGTVPPAKPPPLKRTLSRTASISENMMEKPKQLKRALSRTATDLDLGMRKIKALGNNIGKKPFSSKLANIVGLKALLKLKTPRYVSHKALIWHMWGAGLTLTIRLDLTPSNILATLPLSVQSRKTMVEVKRRSSLRRGYLLRWWV